MSVAQSPEEVLMVRPTNFGFNQQTAVTNHFQVASDKYQYTDLWIL